MMVQYCCDSGSTNKLICRCFLLCTTPYYSCRSQPRLDKDMGNPAKYDCHGEVTEDNSSHVDVGDWDGFDAIINTDRSATHGIASDGSGVIVTTDPPPSDPRIHRQCILPAGKWRSTIQAVKKVVRTALKLVQEDVFLHNVPIASDSMSTPQRIKIGKLPTPTKTRFTTLWLRLLSEGAISLSHGALAILKSAATS